MKKLLLSASLLLAASTAFAVTDGQSYEAKKGLTITNLWTIDRTHNAADYEKLAIANKSARTAATDGKVVYVGLSMEEGQTTLERFDLETGALMEPLALKLNGEAYVGTLCANQVGLDDYGHLYVAPFNANSAGDSAFKVYLVNTETGDLTLVGTNTMDFLGGIGRIDYCDVKGDLTGAESSCTVIAAASNTDIIVFGWTMPQGSTEWEGAFNGMPYQQVTGTYPADQTIFNYGSVAKHVKDGTGDLGMFYVDGFTTFPALYGSDGAIMDHLGNADLIATDKETNTTTGTVPAPNSAGTNGIAELTCGDQNIIGYSEGQYPSAGNAQVIITAVDGEYSFASMEHLWTVPADGFSTTSDGGTRIHCIQGVQLDPDANGKNATLLVTFKCFNGLAVYRIAEEGYSAQGGVAENVVANAQITVNGDVIAVSEVAEAIEVYNIAGQKVAQANNATEVAAPAAGVYVVKATVAGEQTVAKVVVR